MRHAAPIEDEDDDEDDDEGGPAALSLRFILLDSRSQAMIRKLKSGQFRLYSRKVDPKSGKRRNLGTFDTRAAAEKHEREVQFFKRPR